ncbi:MAG: metallophosphatase family protein [Anaerolineae bacterium]|nr:metallophosphatase family protein [Anaerolineae bacterium]
MLVGLLADTHVPYRASELPEAVVASLRGVDLILHAGDVDEPWALAPLQALAPVHAVRGNYHLLDRSSGGHTLPAAVEIEVAGFQIALTHGHRPGLEGMAWKVWALLRKLAGCGYFPAQEWVIVHTLLRRFPRADIIVFGHTHRFYQTQWGRTWLINPGAALRTSYFGTLLEPSVVHLQFELGERPEIRRIPLRFK